MGDVYVQPRYTGTTPGADANTYNLFSTVVAFPGKSFQTYDGIKRLIVDIKHTQTGTLKLYRSQNRGVVWDQIYDSGAIAAPAATSSTIRDFAIEPYMDFKLDWVNGGAAQATWIVDMALVDERSPLV